MCFFRNRQSCQACYSLTLVLQLLWSLQHQTSETEATRAAQSTKPTWAHRLWTQLCFCRVGRQQVLLCDLLCSSSTRSSGIRNCKCCRHLQEGNSGCLQPSPTAGTPKWSLLEAPTGGEQWLPLSHLSSKGFFQSCS